MEIFLKMYRVALVQNESEMMRYGWADVRPSMQKFGYRIDAFTGENVHSLFSGMDENLYDALIISVNACSNHRILSALCEKRDTTIRNFLESGNGIYIGYQAKIGERTSYGFLPEPYDLSAEIRSRTAENTSDGNLIIAETAANHPLTTFPIKINIQSVVEQCLNNNLVAGIYWAHIK